MSDVSVSKTRQAEQSQAEQSQAAQSQAAQSRTLVLWCPDWPVVAAARQANLSMVVPAAVFHANRVAVCNAAARREGVRVGMRRRDAQSRCSSLAVLSADADRDARLFEVVAAAVEEIAPGVEVLRPGVVACSIRGPARYFGSEAAAAERIVDAVEAWGVECAVGIADVLPVAVLAARRSAIVPPGGEAGFCAALPIAELARDPAIALPSYQDLVDLIRRLGMTTAGAFAALPAEKVAARFGADGLALHRLAAGVAERGLSRRSIAADLAVEHVCSPPLERAETAVFVARIVAERFHARLADAGLACSRLHITAATEHGRTVSRVWRCLQPLTAAATADRLRWQLDGWLASGDGNASWTHEGGQADSIVTIRLDPLEAVDAGRLQYGLWGSAGEEEHRAGWAMARVQGLLGPEAVVAAALSGGRGPKDRIALAPWGEERSMTEDLAAPWPGALPSPAPARTISGEPVTVVDALGRGIFVTDRGLLTGAPARIGRSAVVSWAGPWLVDERWWAMPSEGGATAAAGRRARMQVIPDDGPPVLLEFGSHGWRVEAVYD